MIMAVFRRGDRVKISKELKRIFRSNGSAEHVREFGGCLGIVDGPTDYGGGVYGPELDIRWQPSGLRYAYAPEYLQVDRRKIRGGKKVRMCSGRKKVSLRVIRDPG